MNQREWHCIASNCADVLLRIYSLSGAYCSVTAASYVAVVSGAYDMKLSGVCLDCGSFLVHDKASEKKFDFVLANSLSRAANRQLLIGYKIHVTKNVKPEPNQMRGCCIVNTFCVVRVFCYFLRLNDYQITLIVIVASSREVIVNPLPASVAIWLQLECPDVKNYK